MWKWISDTVGPPLGFNTTNGMLTKEQVLEFCRLNLAALEKPGGPVVSRLETCPGAFASKKFWGTLEQTLIQLGSNASPSLCTTQLSIAFSAKFSLNPLVAEVKQRIANHVKGGEVSGCIKPFQCFLKRAEWKKFNACIGTSSTTFIIKPRRGGSYWIFPKLGPTFKFMLFECLRESSSRGLQLILGPQQASAPLHRKLAFIHF